MNRKFRDSMIWLHTYSGLLFGWVLFTIFLTGSLSYYSHELESWMQPESMLYQPTTLDDAIQQLKIYANGASEWEISPEGAVTHIEWEMPGGESGEKIVSSQSSFSKELTLLRDTDGADFFVHFHSALMLDGFGGKYLTAVFAMIMLISVFSGIFTHRKIFIDFFSLRWKKKLRALKDSHALMGVITLPFCIVITVSGMLFDVENFFPAITETRYVGGFDELEAYLSPAEFEREAAGKDMKEIASLEPFLEKVKDFWPEKDSISEVVYMYPYDINAYLIFERSKSNNLSRESDVLIFDAESKALLYQSQTPELAQQTQNVIIGIHEAQYATPALKALLFLLGIFSAGLIATGSIYWVLKRSNTKDVNKFIDRINKVFFLGFPIAILVYFYSNKILPLNIVERNNYEILSLFFSWVILAVIVLSSRYIAWTHLLIIFGIMSISLPFIDFIIQPEYLKLAIDNLNINYLVINVFYIIAGLIGLWLARYIKMKTPKNNSH